MHYLPPADLGVGTIGGERKKRIRCQAQDVKTVIRVRLTHSWKRRTFDKYRMFSGGRNKFAMPFDIPTKYPYKPPTGLPLEACSCCRRDTHPAKIEIRGRAYIVRAHLFDGERLAQNHVTVELGFTTRGHTQVRNTLHPASLWSRAKHAIGDEKSYLLGGNTFNPKAGENQANGVTNDSTHIKWVLTNRLVGSGSVVDGRAWA
eukprot:1192645-Prorocentrum_minimum.AAC.2